MWKHHAAAFAAILAPLTLQEKILLLPKLHPSGYDSGIVQQVFPASAPFLDLMGISTMEHDALLPILSAIETPSVGDTLPIPAATP